MSRFLTIIGSALFIAYLSTEISTRFFAGDFFALLVIVFVGLIVNGLLVSRVILSSNTHAADSAPARQARSKQNNTQNRDRNRHSEDRNKNKNTRKQDQAGERANSQPKKEPNKKTNTREQKPAAKPPAGGEQGTVKWFNRSKGYGFIVRANGDEIFVHQRAIVSDNDRSRPVLRDGQTVQFEVTENERGVQAEQVYPLD